MSVDCTGKDEEGTAIVSFAAAVTGSDLASLCYDAFLTNNDASVATRLASDIVGGLDVVKLICDGTLTSESRGFWQLSNHWSKVVARLPSGFFQYVIDVTTRLYVLGGDDLAAPMPLDALVVYGKKNFSELEQALNYALVKQETICCVLGLIKVGLEGDGNKYLSIAIGLLQCGGLGEKAKGAIYCGLRFLCLDKMSESHKSQFVDILRLGLESNSSDILYAIGGTLIHQYVNTRSAHLWALIEVALSSKFKVASIGVLEQFASLRYGGLPVEVVWQLLGVLIVNDLSERAIRAVDLILAGVWEKSSERALEYIEKLVMDGNGDVSCDSFPDTIQELRKMTGMFVNKSVTRWFLSNDVQLFPAR